MADVASGRGAGRHRVVLGAERNIHDLAHGMPSKCRFKTKEPTSKRRRLSAGVQAEVPGHWKFRQFQSLGDPAPQFAAISHKNSCTCIDSSIQRDIEF